MYGSLTKRTRLRSQPNALGCLVPRRAAQNNPRLRDPRTDIMARPGPNKTTRSCGILRQPLVELFLCGDVHQHVEWPAEDSAAELTSGHHVQLDVPRGIRSRLPSAPTVSDALRRKRACAPGIHPRLRGSRRCRFASGLWPQWCNCPAITFAKGDPSPDARSKPGPAVQHDTPPKTDVRADRDVQERARVRAARASRAGAGRTRASASRAAGPADPRARSSPRRAASAALVPPTNAIVWPRRRAAALHAGRADDHVARARVGERGHVREPSGASSARGSQAATRGATRYVLTPPPPAAAFV